MSTLLKLYPAKGDYENLKIRTNYYVTMWLKIKSQVTIVVQCMNLMSILLKLYPAQADYKNLEIYSHYYVTMWLIKTNKI